MVAKNDIIIKQGKTFSRTLRLEAKPIKYIPILSISQSAPLRIEATSHGIPNGWRTAIASVKGPTNLNHQGNFPKASDFFLTTVVDENIIEYNDINGLSFKPYESGGVLIYYTPIPLAGVSARMSIKDKVGGEELLRLTTENGRIIIDSINFVVTLLISANDTKELSFVKGVYDLELEFPGGKVMEVLSGSVKLEQEITV